MTQGRADASERSERAARDGERAPGRRGDRQSERQGTRLDRSGELSSEDPPASHDAELRAMFGSEGGPLSDGGPDGEMQRAMVAASLFGGPPVSIGRFLVEEVLGVGASAVVYATRDPLLDRRVALKVMARPHPDRREAVLSRVIREARAAAQLSHGNIVSIYEVGEWDGRPFIAMELIEGSTLAQWLVDEPRELAQICEVFLQAGRGLAAAHAQGRVHRDFKPANVLVARHGRVVVSDFGLAGDIRSARSGLAHGTGEMESLLPEAASGPVLGTPAYAAPEQRGGVAAHPSADVYSFAISLIEALLGYHPSAPSSSAHRSTAAGDGSPRRRGAAPTPRAARAPSSLVTAPARPAWQLALRPRIPRQLFVELCAAAQPELWRRSQALDPLLEALRACAPARKRQRRGIYLVGASALALGVALAAAIGAGLSQCGRRAPGFAGGAAFLASPRELAAEVSELLATERAQRNDEWRRRARQLLLQPVATEIPCAWRTPPRDLALAGESALGLDERGDVFACDLRDGSVAATPVTSGAWCVRSGESGSIEVALERGGSETFTATAGRWQRRAALASVEERAAMSRGSDTLCVSSLLSASEQGRSLYLDRRGSSPSDLYYRSDRDPAPRRLAERVVQLSAGPGLRYAVAISSSVIALDLERGRAVVAPTAPVASKGIRVLSLGGDYAVANLLDGPLWWWRRGDDQWHTFSVSPRGVKALAVSPVGRVAVIGGAGQLQVIELESGWRYPLAEGQMRQARFLDAETVVASDVSGRIWRWSLPALRAKILAEHPGSGIMWGLAVSPDASMVASSSGGKDESEVQLTSLRDGEGRAPSSSWRMPAGVGVHALAFQDDLLIAGSTDSVLHRWRWQSGQALPEIQLPRAQWIWTVAPARRRDGSPLLMIGTGRLLAERDPGDARNERDLRMGSRVLSLEGERLRTWYDAPGGNNTGIGSLDVSPDGRLAVAATSALELAVIDLESQRVTAKPVTAVGEVRAARFFDHGRGLIAVADDGYVSLWKVAGGDGGAPLVEKRVSRDGRHGQIYKLAFGAGAAFLGSEDGHVSRVSLTTGEEEASYPGHTIRITSLDVDARGEWIASGDMNGRLCLSRVHGRACSIALVGHQPGFAIQNARFLPDGRLLTSSDDRTVRLWAPLYDAGDEELVRELRRLTFSPAR